MPVPSTVADLSSTASSNYPSGSESIGTSLDDYLRAHASIIKQVSDDAASSADIASTATGKGAALVGFKQAGSGASARTVQDKLQEIELSIVDYGASINGTSDDYTAISSAIAALPATGGRIRIPGVAAIGTKLTINKRVVFVCDGLDGHHDVGSYTPRSGLKWIGAAGGTMMEIIPATGASAQALMGCGVQGGIMFDGNGLADFGLKLISHRFGHFDLLAFKGFRNGADCLTLGVTSPLGEAADCQHNVFDVLVFSQYITSARAVVLTGDTVANASFNRFGNVCIAHTNGDAIALINADNNLFEQVQVFRSGGGTGRGVVFGAGASSAVTARNNHFLNLSTNAGVISQGTPTAAAAALDNTIWMYDKGNGSPDPTVETGSRLAWSSDNGIFSAFGAVGMTMGCSPAEVVSARSATGGVALHLRSNSDQQLRLSSAGDASAWFLRIDSASGNVEFVRTAGSGKLNLPAPIFSGMTLSASATAGASGATPAQVAQYLNINVNGGNYKIPLYNT